MTKIKRYSEFQQFGNCYTLQFDDDSLDLNIDYNKPLILELGCGSGTYTNALAQHFPDKQFIGIDTKSDRLHFGAKYSLENTITNTKRLWASVDHITRCFPENSVDEIWITFPDPRHGRDRQKLTSPKYQPIYNQILKPKGIIHLKTDDKSFFDFSKESLVLGGFEIIGSKQDIYSMNQSTELEYLTNIQTYYEQKWLKEQRKVYYLQVQKLG